MEPDLIAILREKFGFARNPMDCGDNGVAFTCFLNFACGDSLEAHALQAQHFEARGMFPAHDQRADPRECGQFIDWLIENHWGEAEADGLVH